MKMHSARLIIMVLCLAVLSACGGNDKAAPADANDEATVAMTDTAGVPAVLRKNVDLANCLAEENLETAATISSCPTYVLQSLDYMKSECTAAGGALQTMPEAGIWSLEVDGDNAPEVLVDLTQNFTCYGVPSVFSCGSLGCPHFLYSSRGESWVELGAVNADDAPGIEVLTGKPGTPATLRGGCAGQRPCSELTYYKWKGSAYERSWIEYRGHMVDVVPNDLWMMVKDAPVLTSPNKDGQSIDDYPMGTAVVVIGSAREGAYKYVSPCNGCRRGFVAIDVLERVRQ